MELRASDLDDISLTEVEGDGRELGLALQDAERFKAELLMLVAATHKHLPEVGQTNRMLLAGDDLCDIPDIVAFLGLRRHERHVWEVNDIFLELH